MTPGQLVKAMSIALDVPEETVVQHDRNLVVAGLRTKGGRGRSAPEVTALDAARLFIAVLGSMRTKDSVATVKQFDGTIFQADKPTYIYIAGAKLRLEGDPEALEFDSAIARLPLNHNIIEALAALIHEASQPIEDLQSFFDRFAELGVSCSSPSACAKIGGDRYIRYSPVEESQNQTPRNWDERHYYAWGVQQERSAHGSAIMLLGAAFRENGLRYSNAYEAYLAGYGTHDQGRGCHDAQQGVDG